MATPARKNYLLLTDLPFRKLNPDDNLPRKLTLNISTRKIKSGKTKQDKRRISGKFLQNKIPPKKFTMLKIPPRMKNYPVENPTSQKFASLPKMFVYFPLTNITPIQWVNL